MRLVILMCQLGLILRTEAQTPSECSGSDTFRDPENTDIIVTCGTEFMSLSIYICPMFKSGYNESLMVLNNQIGKSECYGTADLTVVPPVLNFKIPLNVTDAGACSSVLTVTNEVGTGEFSDFSNIQFLNMSGTVNSVDPVTGTVTYRSQILYRFSCRYPMQYVMNNTQVSVTGVNVAIQDNNGSFVSTLSMQLFSDPNFEEELLIPNTGLNLKTNIYVAVKATNLTSKFNVLLDRCFASTGPYNNRSTFYDLFVGCIHDPQTNLILNGQSQVAHFSFEAFRFVEHQNQEVSTFYVHCITRLCEVSSCSLLQPDCSLTARRRRAAVTEGATANATVSSGAIRVGHMTNDDSATNFSAHVSDTQSEYSSPVVAVIICLVVIAIILLAMSVYFVLYIRRRPSF
ncbi:hypothetical protein JOB18_018375 [Solea senegalensis]|nr:zona pellucida-like domain-containing protein 1 [Solea senegalensis]KAG7465567.1 hypothetical protein JOB18_018375 [Solea senegalensis]